MFDEIVKYITEETGRYIYPLKDFQEALKEYHGTSSEDVYEKCSLAYKQAVVAMGRWIKMVMSAEVMFFGKTNKVRCKLLLLKGEYLVQTINFESEEESFENDEAQALITPIGEITPFLCRAIIEIPNNPVKMFYESINESIDLYALIDVFENIDEGPHYLVQDYLKLKGYSDPLGVCSLDILRTSIKNFISTSNPLIKSKLFSFKL